MFLTVHSAVGALIGQQISSPILAFVFGFLSHWLLDAIPHGDEALIPDGITKQKKLRLLILISCLDFIGVIIVALTFYKLTSITTSMIIAGFGACLPDILWGTSSLTPIKMPWEFINVFHNKFHTYFKRRVSFKIGLFIQGLTLILTTLAILR